MRLGAILVTGNRSSSPAMMSQWLGRQRDDHRAVPLACVEILGESALHRIADRLRKAGVQAITVISAPGCAYPHRSRDVKFVITEEFRNRWSAAECALQEHARHGINTVLVAELGTYVEFNLPAILQFHQAKKQLVTPLHDKRGALGYWIVDTAGAQLHREFCLPLTEGERISPPAPLMVEGYVNRLINPYDLRQLVIDAFVGRCLIVPSGREIKPGVWVDEGVRLHKTARLVAPVYVGCNTRVRSAAVVTRFSNLERNCVVGEGSVIANSSVLPDTVIGRELDVSAALVDGSEFVALGHNVALEIQDPSLISVANAARANSRIASHPHEQETTRSTRVLDADYPQYLARAAGRLLEVFRGEV